MERKRQIPQDLNRLYSKQIRLTEESIGIYAVKNVLREIEVASRVEGRTVKMTREVPTLVQQAEYPDVATYAYERAQAHKSEPTQESMWMIEDIPADIVAECDAYIGVKERQFADINAVVDKIVQQNQNVDRMTATQVCPQCKGVDTYLCYVCGSARKIYSYPLVRVRDAATGQLHEVPFDSALYMQQHPVDFTLNTEKSISDTGRLSAKYMAKIRPTVFSQGYVEQVTNGVIVPSEAGLEYADSDVFLNATVELASWAEGSTQNRYYEHITTSTELVKFMQTHMAKMYSERVEDIDYNGKLRTIQHTLGAHGLELFYHWRSGGMGDWDVIYSARGDGDVKVKDAYSGDAYEGLLKFEQNLNEALPTAE